MDSGKIRLFFDIFSWRFWGLAGWILIRSVSSLSHIFVAVWRDEFWHARAADQFRDKFAMVSGLRSLRSSMTFVSISFDFQRCKAKKG